MSVFAERLNSLIETARKPDGSAYTQAEIAYGAGMSAVHLWKLMTGKTSNPSYEIIGRLANFFGVSPAYFFEKIDYADEALVQAQIAALLNGLEPAEREAALRFVESALGLTDNGA